LFDFGRLKTKKTGRIPDLFIGAGGRNRTVMELPPEDFESSASTSFTTPARDESYTNLLLLSSKNRLLKKPKITENVILSTAKNPAFSTIRDPSRSLA
jgi:hypothetical protein